jgi:hypothetical protein
MASPQGRILTYELKRSSNAFPQPVGCSGMLFDDLLAHSGGPVPDSHRLPVYSIKGTNAQRGGGQHIDWRVMAQRRASVWIKFSVASNDALGFRVTYETKRAGIDCDLSQRRVASWLIKARPPRAPGEEPSQISSSRSLAVNISV